MYVTLSKKSNLVTEKKPNRFKNKQKKSPADMQLLSFDLIILLTV